MQKYFQSQRKTRTRQIVANVFFWWFELRYYPGAWCHQCSFSPFLLYDTVSFSLSPGVQNRTKNRVCGLITSRSWVQEPSIPVEVNTMQLSTVWWWNAWPRTSTRWSGSILGLRRSSSSRCSRCTSGQVMRFSVRIDFRSVSACEGKSK